MNARFTCFVVLLAVLGITFAHFASADPLPGEILKFRQLPLNNGQLPAIPPISLAGAPYPGHDELSTAVLVPGQNLYEGDYMADDFADKFNSPVLHVRWWGSYMNNTEPTGAGVKRFLISFENDVPVGPNNPFSHPGEERFNQIVTLGPLAPGSGTFTQKAIPTPIIAGGTPPVERLFEYNAELNLGKEFKEDANKVYWLKIVALVNPAEDGPLQWGWHNRDWSIFDPLASSPPAVIPGEGPVGSVPGSSGGLIPVFHFQDDAVTGRIRVFPNTAAPIMPFVEQIGWSPTNYVPPVDGPSVIGQFSKDLAFELYTTVPEPATLALVLLGFAGLSARVRYRS